MSDRASRRKALQFDEELELKGVKDIPLPLAEVVGIDEHSFTSVIEKHIKTMLVAQYHQQVVGVVFLNGDELYDLVQAGSIKRLQCHCKVTVKVDSESKQDEIMVVVRLVKDDTPQKAFGYFEGIIQIRDVSKEELDFILELLGQKEVGIAKEVKHPNGFDWYIDNNHKAQAAMQMVKRRFRGELNVTTKLQSFDHLRSKELRRVTMLYRGKK